ncbi:hypothetical protein FOXYS1_13431, partial [Fusarium oxysporum]
PIESEDVTMTGSDLAAANSPPDLPQEGDNNISVCCAVTPSPANRSDPATGDKPSSPDAPSPVTDDTTGQPTQSPGVSERASSSEPQSPMAHTEAKLHGDRLASPPVNGEIRPNEDSRADDFTQVIDSAMDMLAAATEQGHSPGSGDEQHTGDQQTESPSAGPPSEQSDTASTPPAIQFTPSNGSSSYPPATTLTLTPADIERLIPKLAEIERKGDT